MDNHIIANHGLWHEIQLNLSRNAAELHPAKPAAVFFFSLKNLPRNCQTHNESPRTTCSNSVTKRSEPNSPIYCTLSLPQTQAAGPGNELSLGGKLRVDRTSEFRRRSLSVETLSTTRAIASSTASERGAPSATVPASIPKR